MSIGRYGPGRASGNTPAGIPDRAEYAHSRFQDLKIASKCRQRGRGGFCRMTKEAPHASRCASGPVAVARSLLKEVLQERLAGFVRDLVGVGVAGVVGAEGEGGSAAQSRDHLR